MTALAVTGWIVGILVLIFLYWLPTFVAWERHVPHLGSVAVINGLLGFTLVGWAVALAMACRSVPAELLPPSKPFPPPVHRPGLPPPPPGY